MSRETLSHMSAGRTPWRPWVQLRRNAANYRAAHQQPPGSLDSAACRAQAPVHWSSWRRDEAQRRLRVLCAWLDERLAKPVRVQRIDRNCRRLVVFDGLVYVVDASKRYVGAGSIECGEYVTGAFKFEVGRPLASANWLPPIVRSLNLADANQGDLFFEAAEAEELAFWLAQAAYRLLVRNPDFQRLRKNILPGMFKIPKALYGIALASRTRPVGPMLDSHTLNNVWRNEAAFRQTARENPHLLPLMLAFVEQIPSGETVPAPDPIRALKTRLRDSGVSEATWRYVVRHGSRLFRIPWEIAPGQAALEVALRYVFALQSAGLPPPPPPLITRAFLHGYNPHRRNHVRLNAGFENSIDSVALRAGFLEADRRRTRGEVDSFAEEFLGVCWWSEAVPAALDRNQLRAGWSWFVRQWKEDEATQALLDSSEVRAWPTRLDAFTAGHFSVVPIRSQAELIFESLAMRNCLQTFADQCADGSVEVYSVRDTVTCKRKGCIGLVFDADGTVSLVDVKGFANMPPTGDVSQIAYALVRKLNSPRTT